MLDANPKAPQPIGSPLVHVVFCVVQPHPDLDGVPLPDPVEDVFHGGAVLALT